MVRDILRPHSSPHTDVLNVEIRATVPEFRIDKRHIN
jgi:hypothetical protein